MSETNEFSVSPKSGRLRKRKRLGKKKKRAFFSKKKFWKLFFNPFTFLLLISLLALITYLALPESKPLKSKFKVRSDTKTTEVNKRLSETDGY